MPANHLNAYFPVAYLFLVNNQESEIATNEINIQLIINGLQNIEVSIPVPKGIKNRNSGKRVQNFIEKS